MPASASPTLARARDTLRKLDEQSRALVELLALFHDPVPRTDLARALGRLGYRVGTRAPSGQDILPSLEALSASGVVENAPAFTVARGLAHAAALCAVEEGAFAVMAETVRRIRPMAADRPTVRELRLTLYAGRWDEARPLVGALGAGAFAEICRPFDRAWIVALPADLRCSALRAVLHASTVTLEPAPEALALLEAEPEPDDKAHRVLIEQMVLRGRLDDAERLLAGRTSLEAEAGRAFLLFLRGRRAEAVAAYEAALRAFLARAGKRARFFPDRGGAFFVVALLDEDRPAASARAKALAEGAKQGNISGIPDAYAVLSEVAEVRSGEREVERCVSIGNGFDLASRDPIEILLRALAAGWVGARLAPELARDLEQRVLRAEAAGYAWLAGQGADALLRTSARKGAAHLQALRDGLSGVRLAGLLARPEPWSGALDALLEVASAGQKKAAPGGAVEHDRRLVWVVLDHNGWLSPEPREQMRGKGGFSKGRPVALKRLRDEARTMDFLRPEDRAAALAIQEHATSSYYGRYQDISYHLDDGRAFQALVGHPAVFLEHPKKPGELLAAEVRRGRARLRAERSPQGIRLTLDPMARNNDETIVARRVGDTTIEVVDLAPAHHAIGRALGKKGLLVPGAAEERVRAVLGALSGVVAVDAEIDAGTDVAAEPGDPRPTVVLRPLGAGVSAEIVVRPLGAGGPPARPGQGGTTILAEIGGQRRKATRDLAAEARRLDEVMAACPALAAAERTAAGLVLADRERALQALVELRALGDGVALAWPDGAPLDVTAEVTLDQLRFSVRADGDAFAVTGALVLPGGRRLELAELLGYLAAAPGRFLQLEGDARFLALHADLRQRLADLAALAGPGGKRSRVPALLAPLLHELLTGAQLDADSAFRKRLAAFAPGPDPELPPTFRGELRPYQLDGFRWLARLSRLGAGACLADDMGLGKTVQALALLVLRAPEGPSMVVAPTSVVPGWLDEAARFAPTLRPRAYAGEGRAAQLADLGPFDLVVTSYALLQQDVEQLAAVPWVVALLDEAQAIKNADTLRARAAVQLDARQRIATTGTPVENRLEDLHGIFRFLNPSLLGSSESFAARFVRPIERDRDAAARDRLRRVVGPFVLRRTKTDVLPELPARTETTLRVTLGVEEIALYEAIRAEALASLTGGEAADGRRRIQLLAAITRLRRAASHARLVLPEAELAGAKLAALGELLDEILPGGHRVLVFSQFVDHLTLVRAFLDERGVTYQYLDGSTPPAKRRAAINAFQAGQGDAFLISLRAGGFGLNLTAADYVVHMDPWWNPAVEDQASDRAHRIGQTRPVTIYRLVARDTIEDQILALHHKKRELAASLLEGTEIAARMTEEELLDLVRAEGPLSRGKAQEAPGPAAQTRARGRRGR
jgi:hypothetical protein